MRKEWFLALSVATCIAFALFGNTLLGSLSNPVWLLLVFIWLFTIILGSALSVVRQADHLAARLGEPLGTLILTLSVTAIEVMTISAVMMHGENNPTLARDTLFAIIMIILNGMVGVSLVVGGWRHREQQYNLQGANAYLSVIIPLAVLGLIMPNFTRTATGPTLSFAQQIFLASMSIGLYGTFLAVQTGRHRGYFSLDSQPDPVHAIATPQDSRPLLPHAILLAAHMLPVVYLAEKLAHPIDYLIETMRAPAALGGVIIAVLVAAPEAISATRAAVSNHLQRSVNIFLGSVLSTIGLTIPIMLVIGRLTGNDIILGLQNSSFVMLLLTLFLSAVTFASGRTNILQGAVHVLLFLAFLLLIFQG